MKLRLYLLTCLSAAMLLPAILHAQRPTAVDMGLSVKWASCNVGASYPEEFGDYYAWGETRAKQNYSLSTYRWYDSVKDQYTKYSVNQSGNNDNRFRLAQADDAASVQMGGSWRMPTLDEFKERLANTVRSASSRNGVPGLEFKSLRNGAVLFFPFSGSQFGTDTRNVGKYAFYWSASLDARIDCDMAWFLSISSSGANCTAELRADGYVVRAVCP